MRKDVFCKRVPLLVLALLLVASTCFADDTILDSWSTGFWATLGAAVLAVLNWVSDAFILVIGYTAYYIFDGLLSLVDLMFQAVGLANMLGSVITQISGLPSSMLWLLNQMGFFTGLALIIPAMVARKIIDVIPGGWQV